MKVEIWSRKPAVTGARMKKVWTGNLPCIPRVGEFVTIKDGYADEEVLLVSYFLDQDSPSVILEIAPDTANEYREVK